MSQNFWTEAVETSRRGRASSPRLVTSLSPPAQPILRSTTLRLELAMKRPMRLRRRPGRSEREIPARGERPQIAVLHDDHAEVVCGAGEQPGHVRRDGLRAGADRLRGRVLAIRGGEPVLELLGAMQDQKLPPRREIGP